MTIEKQSPLNRYIQILEAVGSARTGLTLTEIGQQLDLRAPTVHRLVGGLRALDLLTNREGAKSYVLGRRIQNLLHSTLTMTEYSNLPKTVLSGLVEEFGETAHLAKLNGNIAESILMEQPQGANRAFVQPGRELPLHAAASGKAILAFQDEEFVARYLARPRVRYTEHTKFSGSEIRRELKRVRKTGMAVCDSELDFGVLSYGYPIRVKGGHVLYSIGVTGLANRLRNVSFEKIKKKLSEAAALLSKELGSSDLY